MYYFDLYTTNECNLCCAYCVQDRAIPQKANYNFEHLKQYIMSFEGEKCIVFYGGEPLLNYGFIRDIKKSFAPCNIKFGIQTNGTLLNRILPEDISLFDMIMISIDGDEVAHNRFRGSGTYRAVLENVKGIKGKPKIYARITISDAMKYIDYSIMELINCFDGLYWQTCDKEYLPDTYIGFSESYNKQIDRVIDFWYYSLCNGVVLPLASFNLIYRDLALNLKHTKVRCGANSTHFTIYTDGGVFPCVDSVFEPGYRIGHISQCDYSRKHANSTSCEICARCCSCVVKDICGGACWMDIHNTEIAKEYSYVKCSNIISIIKHIEGYVNIDKAKYISAVQSDIQKNALFYEYCEEIP